jgi:hypothetical protein
MLDLAENYVEMGRWAALTASHGDAASDSFLPHVVAPVLPRATLLFWRRSYCDTPLACGAEICLACSAATRASAA